MRRNPQTAVLDAVSSALGRAGVDARAYVLAGVSGGADSVAMLDALVELRPHFGFRIAAAHLNHRIRAEESDRDEAFVRDLCAQLAIELAVEHAGDLGAAAGNLEERARDARHAFFYRTADALGATHIALAHTADDQAETVLMRLLRGAGAAGLAAMSERGPGRIVRPMLTVSRDAILSYLRARKLDHVEDSSNRLPSYLRNRIRIELLPMLEREYAPGLGQRLVELATEMRSLDDFVSGLAARELDALLGAAGWLDLARLGALHPALQAAVLRRFIERRAGTLRRITRAHIDALRRLALDGPPNGTLALPGGFIAVREYERLLLVPRAGRERAPRFAVPLVPNGSTIVAEAGFAFDARVLPRCDVKLPADQLAAVFDLTKLGAAPLVVRNFITGDRIAPLGIAGTRKLKDVFIDHKLPRPRRASWPVVTLGSEVVWLPGIMRSGIALVSSATETAVSIEAHCVAV